MVEIKVLFKSNNKTTNNTVKIERTQFFERKGIETSSLKRLDGTSIAMRHAKTHPP